MKSHFFKMLKVKFFLRNAESATPEKQCTIYCQLEIEGQTRSTPFTTHLQLPAKHWQAGQISKDYFMADILTAKLEQITRHLHEHYIALAHMGETIDYQVLKNSILDKKKKKAEPKPFIDVALEAFEFRKKKKKLTPNTIKTYKTRLKNIDEWLAMLKLQKIKITDIKYRHIEDLMSFLEAKQCMAIDHINKHAIFVKQTLEYAVNAEYLTHSPVSKLNLTFSPEKDPNYLEYDQRYLIINNKSKALEKCRDIAIFLMYTGFSYTDYLTLTDRHLVASKEGLGFKKQRNKSNVFSLPPLLPEAKAIIEKYGQISALPRPDLSDLNKELKFLGEACGITADTVGFKLSTSVFRETFASMMENEYMMQTRTIMFMIGHTTTRQLNKYSKLKPARIIHEMKKAS